MSQDIFTVNLVWVDCLQNEITDRSPEKLLIESGCYIRKENLEVAHRVFFPNQPISIIFIPPWLLDGVAVQRDVG